jgi:hypothetical protein
LAQTGDCSSVATRRPLEENSMRRIRRMMVVAIAVAGVLVAPTTTTPAHAEILRERAKWCGGEEIRTCLWLNIDTTNHKIRGYAWIRDAIPRADL